MKPKALRFPHSLELAVLYPHLLPVWYTSSKSAAAPLSSHHPLFSVLNPNSVCNLSEQSR